MTTRQFLILGLFVAFIFARIFEIRNQNRELKDILTTSFETNECYDVDELNIIICKKEVDNQKKGE